MSYWWYNFKFFGKNWMLDKYAQMCDKRYNLCLAREEDNTGKRLFFIVHIEKFLNFYSGMTNLHYYEVTFYLRFFFYILRY